VTVTGHPRAETVPASAIRDTGLDRLMRLTPGRPDVVVGLVDGPIADEHPGLEGARVRALGRPAALDGAARRHGTFVAGMLCATRASGAPALCPGCSFVHSVVFRTAIEDAAALSADPAQLAGSLVDCVDAGAQVINISLAAAPSSTADRDLQDALSYALSRRVVVVAAAGNDGTLGSSAITRHPAVVPVVACDSGGRPLPASTLGASIARRGLAAPGAGVTSLNAEGGTVSWSGTSVAAPFVTGALALLRSLVPAVPALEALSAVRRAASPRGRSIVPAALNASAALALLNHMEPRR
jgi:subtilisin family serine protease